MKISELPESIILKDEHFKICLNTVIETVRNEIWKENLIKHYTKHGIDHSERIVQYLGKLLEAFPALLNQQERFVLLAAIFLHDIGNQLPGYAGISIKSTYNTEELEKIRKNHHLSSCQAIKDSIKANAKLSLGLNLCKEYTDFIALLCKYHRKLDLKYLKDTSIAGDPLRLHLLGALLKLGDELDADYRRVNMEVLNIIDISTESKFYWWSHHYVQSISIDHGHIKLFFWFPEEYKNNNIIEVFQTKRNESLRKQFLEVYDIFDSYGVRLYRDIEMEDANYLPAGSLKPVPPVLLKYIETTIIQTGNNYKKLSLKTGVTWEIDGVLYSDDAKVVEALTKIPQLMRKFKYKEAIKVIEDTRLLTILPKDRMIFSGIAGNCYFALCDFEKAKSYYVDQFKLSEGENLKNIYPLNTIWNQSVSLNNIGHVFQIQGNLEKSLKYYQQALKINREIGNKDGEAVNIGNIGVIYRIQGNLKYALKYYQQALEINREIGNKEREAGIISNIGVIYRIQGNLEKALKYYQQALEIDKKIGFKEGKANDINNIGVICKFQGKPKEALKNYQQALEINRGIGNKDGEAVNIYNMGDIYLIQGNPKKALYHYKEALKIYKTLEDSTNIKKINKIIKNIDEDIKNKVVDDITQNNQEKSKITKNTKKPEIFLSYSHKDKEIADRVDKFFISKNIRLTRDVRDALPFSSLNKFMDTIRGHDYVILLISDAYLKSINCMYEVIQFIQEKKYKEKTFPIIIDKQADIFNRVKHIDYINFWQK
jgi:tetratricopeptide (TPR) repeat protein